MDGIPSRTPVTRFPPPFIGAGAQQIRGVAPYRLGKGVAHIPAGDTEIGQHAIIDAGKNAALARLRKLRNAYLAP